MTQEITLLPCPFCGGEAELITGAPEIFVRCISDNCLPGRNFIETAVSDWNRRAINPTTVAVPVEVLSGLCCMMDWMRNNEAQYSCDELRVMATKAFKTLQPYTKGER